MERIKN